MSRQATKDLLLSVRRTIEYGITIALGVLCAYGIIHARW
jgi:hypothetical protein